MLEQFTQIGDKARAALGTITDAESLEAFRIQYLGRKGEVTGMLSMIGNLPKELKKDGGLPCTLADAGISVNPVSAYYHDHLFVPVEKAGQAMQLLATLAQSHD